MRIFSDVTGKAIRQIVLEQSKSAHVGHIGSSLSVADLIAALYGRILNVPSPDDPERDRFILSKGHAALALYAALYLRGWINAETLKRFHTDNSPLGVHPEPTLRRCRFRYRVARSGITDGRRCGAGGAFAEVPPACFRAVKRR